MSHNAIWQRRQVIGSLVGAVIAAGVARADTPPTPNGNPFVAFQRLELLGQASLSNANASGGIGLDLQIEAISLLLSVAPTASLTGTTTAAVWEALLYPTNLGGLSVDFRASPWWNKKGDWSRWLGFRMRVDASQVAWTNSSTNASLPKMTTFIVEPSLSYYFDFPTQFDYDRSKLDMGLVLDGALAYRHLDGSQAFRSSMATEGSGTYYSDYLGAELTVGIQLNGVRASVVVPLNNHSANSANGGTHVTYVLGLRGTFVDLKQIRF